MKYMVMECHPGYAVVLDEEGCFSRVANMQYEVGQTVTHVIPMEIPTVQTPVKGNRRRWLASLAAVAACLLLFLLPRSEPHATYASVYMTINPEIRIDVDHNDMVIALEGINADGTALIRGYSFEGKSLDLVVDELVDRSIVMGFLHDGGTVTLELDAEDREWVIAHTDTLSQQLSHHLENKLSVTIDIHDKETVSVPVRDDDDMDDDDEDDDDRYDIDNDDDRDDIDNNDDDNDDNDDDDDDNDNNDNGDDDDDNDDDEDEDDDEDRHESSDDDEDDDD